MSGALLFVICALVVNMSLSSSDKRRLNSGTAPTCRGKCPHNYCGVIDENGYGDGASCWTGTKQLCRHRDNVNQYSIFFGMPQAPGHGHPWQHGPHGHGHHPHHGLAPYWRSVSGPETGMSEVINNKEKFMVNLDVSHFTPEEIKVKTTADGVLVVEGRHEERADEHGYIERHFKRKYMLPKSVDPQTVESHLSHEGTLTIEAPKKQEESEWERHVPIQMKPKSEALEAKKQ